MKMPKWWNRGEVRFMPCSGRVTTASKPIVELEFDSALVCNKGSFKQDPLDL